MLSASEQPALESGISTVRPGARILAVSAMKYTPANTIVLAVLAAARGRWVGAPRPGRPRAPPGPGRGPRLPEISQAGDLPQPGQPGERFRHEVLAVVLRVRGKSLEALLWQRSAPPFEERWSLPGGPLGASERLGTSAGRHLAPKGRPPAVPPPQQL